MKISENRYLQGFCLAVVVLGIVRAAAPRVGMSADERRQADSVEWVSDSIQWVNDSILRVNDSLQHVEDSIQAVRDSLENAQRLKLEAEREARGAREKAAKAGASASRFFNADGTPARHRIVSVRSYSDAFPDLQEVQIVSAKKWGVSPVWNRQEAEGRKSELVYVGSNPNFFIEPLYWSIPYLVPRAAVLLQDIGRNFLDSLQVKGVSAHKIIVTSVMRTKEEVERMRAQQAEDTAIAQMKIEELKERVLKTRAEVAAGQQRLLQQAQGLQDDLRLRLRSMLEDIRHPNDRFM